MSYLPQSNATLKSIAPESVVEDWDEAEVDSGAIWRGEAEAFVEQTTRTVYDAAAGALRHVQDLKLYLGYDFVGDLGQPLRSGHYVVFNDGNTDRRHRVMEVNTPIVPATGPLAAMPGQAVTVHLDPSTTET